MLQEFLQVDVDMTVVVLAVEDWLASAILATSDMELELSSIEDFVVAIERTEEDSRRLDCFVLFCWRIITSVEVVRACHNKKWLCFEV